MQLAQEYPKSSALGGNSLRLAIAGEIWEIASSSPELTIAVDKRTDQFRAEPVSGVANVRIVAQWAASLEPRENPLFDAGLWRSYRQESDLLFDFYSAVIGPKPYKRAIFDQNLSNGRVLLNSSYLARNQAWNPLEYPLDELLCMHRLARGGGVELHSCGVVTRDGKGILFVGHSGAGKSTTARLWMANAKARILSDDRIVVRRRDGRFWMYGTPWHGEAGLAENVVVPLREIFVIEHGARNELASLAGPIAVSEMMTRAFVPFYDSEAVTFALGFLQELATKIPVQRLRFVPDASVVDFVLERL